MPAVVDRLVSIGRLRFVKGSIRGRHTLTSVLRLQHPKALNLRADRMALEKGLVSESEDQAPRLTSSECPEQDLEECVVMYLQ